MTMLKRRVVAAREKYIMRARDGVSGKDRTESGKGR